MATENRRSALLATILYFAMGADIYSTALLTNSLTLAMDAERRNTTFLPGLPHHTVPAHIMAPTFLAEPFNLVMMAERRSTAFFAAGFVLAVDTER